MDAFGDRMKLYEKQEAERRLLPLLPVCSRIDGKGFSEFTKGLKRPYDERIDMPPFARVTNRVGVVFSALDPEVCQAE